MEFLNSITSDAMYSRLRELATERPDIDVVLKLLGEARYAEWLHALGPTYDEKLRALLPPVAPLSLRSITGQRHEENYRWRGACDISNLIHLYERYAPNRPKRTRVLDFGCGGGRLTRYLGLSDHHDTVACDANPEHVDWCAANLPNVSTRLNQRIPPLPFDNQSIDFAYAWSVFTHLPRNESEAWFADLVRVLRPGGILIATIHGYPALKTLTKSQPHQQLLQMRGEEAEALIRRLQKEAYIFLPYEEPVIKMANVGANYGNSFIDVGQTSQLWDNAYELLAHLPGGALPEWQDALVLRAR